MLKTVPSDSMHSAFIVPPSFLTIAITHRQTKTRPFAGLFCCEKKPLIIFQPSLSNIFCFAVSLNFFGKRSALTKKR